MYFHDAYGYLEIPSLRLYSAVNIPWLDGIERNDITIYINIDWHDLDIIIPKLIECNIDFELIIPFNRSVFVINGTAKYENYGDNIVLLRKQIYANLDMDKVNMYNLMEHI